MSLQTALELAGMSTNEAGATGSWPLPKVVTVDNGAIGWAGWSGRKVADAGLLGRFLAHAGASEQQVVEFARREGVLLPPAARRGQTGVQLVADGGVEPVALWRCLVADVRRLLEVSAQLHQGRATAPDAWAGFATFAARRSAAGVTVNVGRVGRPGRQAGLRDVWGQPDLPASMSERQAVGWILSTWLRASSTQLAVRWTGDLPELAVTSPGLLSALVVQTSQMVSLSTQVAFCRGCGAPFARRHGNRRYCDGCRDLNEPQRRATAEYRRRQRSV